MKQPLKILWKEDGNIDLPNGFNYHSGDHVIIDDKIYKINKVIYHIIDKSVYQITYKASFNSFI